MELESEKSIALNDLPAYIDRLREELNQYQKAYAEHADLVQHLKQEASIQAQEARTQRATVRRIYQLLTHAQGEPGDWHGEKPVADALRAKDLRYIDLLKKYREMVAVYDKQVGTPCEQVRHAEEVKDLKEEIQCLSEQVAGLNQGCLDYEKQISDDKRQISKLERRVHELEHQHENLCLRNQILRDRIDLPVERASFHDAVLSIQVSEKEVRDRLVSTQAELEGVRKERDGYETSLRQAYKDLADEQVRNKHLQADVGRLKKELYAEQGKTARAVRDRADVLSVKSTDGLSSSEWLMRTATAERKVKLLSAILLTLPKVDGEIYVTLHGDEFFLMIGPLVWIKIHKTDSALAHAIAAIWNYRQYMEGQDGQ